MKITLESWHYIICKSESERNDVIALCELLGFKKYGYDFEFKTAPNIMVIGGTYQPTSTAQKDLSIQAKDFIRDNF